MRISQRIAAGVMRTLAFQHAQTVVPILLLLSTRGGVGRLLQYQQEAVVRPGQELRVPGHFQQPLATLDLQTSSQGGVR